MISKNDKIESGTIKLQDKAVPPLHAGTYTVKVSIDLGDLKGEKPQPYINAETNFTVAAPRFVFDPALIYSVYPAAGSKGAYQADLPHLVLSKKTLPWERQINAQLVNSARAGDPEMDIPWLYLLLLTDEEIKKYSIASTPIPAGALTDAMSNDKLLTPSIKLEKWESGANMMANVLDMPLSLFKNICPTIEELPFLVHTRQVDMTDKENADVNPKGWFSVLVGNRMPNAKASNTVYLVSLEGHQAVLTNTEPRGKESIRLIVFSEWSFNSEGATFDQLLRKLKENVKPLRIEQTEMPIEGEDKTAKAVKHALQYGYTPMSHSLRTGKLTQSWYRGPLVPVDVPTPQQFQYDNADQALRFDEQTGMFDISYSSAWQLGKLLALQNAGFATQLNNWKTTYKRDKPLNVAKSIMTVRGEVNPNDHESMMHLVESNDILTDFMIELWNNQE